MGGQPTGAGVLDLEAAGGGRVDGRAAAVSPSEP